MLHDRSPGVDNGKESWYPIPYYKFTNGTVTHCGTYKSIKCIGFTYDFEKQACINCKNIRQLDSFKRRLKDRKISRDITKIRNDRLTNNEVTEKMSQQATQLEKAKLEIFCLKQRNLVKAVKVRDLKERLWEFAKEGDMRAICKGLVHAHEEGKLENKDVLLSLLSSTAKNFHVRGNKGKRYEAPLKNFFEVLMIYGGPRIASFVSVNLEGPMMSSIRRWTKDASVSWSLRDTDANIIIFKDILVKALEEVNIVGPIPSEISEDETSIIGRISYNQKTDELLGVCGESGKDHTCDGRSAIKVGDGIAGYSNIVRTFDNMVIGKYARVLILNPLHPKLPKLPVVLMNSCNKFKASLVEDQLQEVLSACRNHLNGIVSVTGHASDGDSRRRKVQLEILANISKNNFQPIPRKLGFHLCAIKEDIPGGGYEVSRIGNQDMIHCHKKLINHLDLTSRTLMLGKYMIHMNHIMLLVERQSAFDHGLSKSHVHRNDRQNWRICQDLSMIKVTDCFEKILKGSDGHAPDTSVLGTMLYLRLLHYYVDIFHSPILTLADRVRNASLVITFLGIWKNFIEKSPVLNIKENFLTRETYSDTMISCHAAVSYVCFMRDNSPTIPCYLSEMGSDCCEKYFSRNGQWSGNHHTYDFGTMFNNLNHMIRIEQIEVDNNSPKFLRNHRKQENIWKKQYNNNESLDIESLLSEYPSECLTIEKWKEGMSLAQEMAMLAGITPTLFKINSSDDSSWFFSPHYTKSNYQSLWSWSLQDDANNEDFEEGDEARDEEEEDRREYSECENLGDNEVCLEDINDVDFIVQSLVQENEKISPVVSLPDGKGSIYKSTLVSMLNEHKTVSKDRLTRVKHNNKNGCNNLDNGDEKFHVFDDVAIIDFKTKHANMSRIVRMRKKGKKKGSFEIKGFITRDEVEDVIFQLKLYEHVREESYISTDEIMIYHGSNKKSGSSKYLASIINMTFLPETDLFTLPMSVKSKIEELLIDTVSRDESNARASTSASNESSLSILDNYGRVTTVLKPCAISDDGNRRSSRVRTHYSHISEF